MVKSSPIPKRKRCWLRFGLGTFLILLTFIVFSLAWFVNRVERQKSTVRWVNEYEGSIYYDYQVKSIDDIYVDSIFEIVGEAPPPGPKWLRQIIGIDYFSNVVMVNFFGDSIIDLSPLGSFTNLKSLLLHDVFQIADLGPLAKLESLEGLYLAYAPVRELKPLRSLSGLKRLHLEGMEVSDLTSLSGLTRLEVLHIVDLKINDLTPLKSLNNLKFLTVSETEIKNLNGLENLTNLEYFRVFKNDGISKAEIEKLEKALPNCFVDHDFVGLANQ